MMLVGEGRVKLDKVPDVVGEKRPLFLNGYPQLFLVRETQAMHVDGRNHVIATIAEDFCQEGPDIFIQQKLYRRHASSDCWRMSLSRKRRWS